VIGTFKSLWPLGRGSLLLFPVRLARRHACGLGTYSVLEHFGKSFLPSSREFQNEGHSLRDAELRILREIEGRDRSLHLKREPVSVSVRSLLQIANESRDEHLRIRNAVSLGREIPDLQDILEGPDIRRNASGALSQGVVSSGAVKDYAIRSSEDLIVSRLDEDFTREGLAVGLELSNVIFKVDKRLTGSSFLAGDGGKVADPVRIKEDGDVQAPLVPIF
jgi:hypothetical protein